MVALFVVAAAIVGYLVWLWQTNEVLTEQVLATLDAEADGCASSTAGGRSGWRQRSPSARSRPVDPALSRADGDGAKLAGNLDACRRSSGEPRAVVFRTTALRRAGRERATPSASPIAFRCQAAIALIVGRDIEEQRELRGPHRAASCWASALLALLGIGGGYRRQPQHARPDRGASRDQPHDHGRRPLPARARRRLGRRARPPRREPQRHARASSS